MNFFKKHKKGLIIFGVIAVVLVGGYFWLRSIGTKALEQLSAMSSETAVVEKRDLANVVSATGTIVSLDSKDISSTVTGVKVSDVFQRDPGYYGWVQQADFTLNTKQEFKRLWLKYYVKR